MLTFQDYILKLKLLEIPTLAIEACEDFVNKEIKEWNLDDTSREFGWTASFDLGFAELSSITSKNQSINEIVNTLRNSVCDFDNSGRDISKKRYQQLVNNPDKYFKRIVLKSYFLHLFNLNQEPVLNPNQIKLPDTKISTLYKMNAFKKGEHN